MDCLSENFQLGKLRLDAHLQSLFNALLQLTDYFWTDQRSYNQ